MGGGKKSSTGGFFSADLLFSAVKKHGRMEFEGRGSFQTNIYIYIHLGVLCELDGVTNDTLTWVTPVARKVIYPTTKSHLLHTSHLL